MTKEIDRDTYLKALGLFTLGRHHAEKQTEFSDALHKQLGIDDGGNFSDALYDFPGGVSFDEAMEREGIVVKE